MFQQILCWSSHRQFEYPYRCWEAKNLRDKPAFTHSISWKNILQRVEAKAMDGTIQIEDSLARLVACHKRHPYCYLHDVSQKSPQQSARHYSIYVKYYINPFKPTQVTKLSTRYPTSIQMYLQHVILQLYQQHFFSQNRSRYKDLRLKNPAAPRTHSSHYIISQHIFIYFVSFDLKSKSDQTTMPAFNVRVLTSFAFLPGYPLCVGRASHKHLHSHLAILLRIPPQNSLFL